ncbi:Zinc finger, B-box [Corchorus olitorius]|uniref:Zinc finger, B-box n=1 Tax=Corchorus olitorius TaxID=93759 RepID=A0A1R3HZ44_9ROSI|nr:Zinc finger, B-box [Corchorus olitorius]
MKIWCDVCNKEEAIFFCSADEAALCENCDRRVHHANKLASKHSRFSLLHPTFKESPLCDICQERRAFLFCQEDRAILCRECDFPIHRANEHTQKHNRFLLTGVKLSSSSSSPVLLNPTSSSSNGYGATVDSDQTTHNKSKSHSSKRFCSGSPSNDQKPYNLPCSTAANYRVEDNSDTASISTSSISEYLMETLPGWRVDDFLDPSNTANGFCKTIDEQVMIKGGDFDCFSSKAIWVPQVSYSPPQTPQLSFFVPGNDFVDGFKEAKDADVLKFGCEWDDDSFLVPQISSSSHKKSRHFR